MSSVTLRVVVGDTCQNCDGVRTYLVLWRIGDHVARQPVPVRVDLGAVGALHEVEVTGAVSSATSERVTESGDARGDVLLLTSVLRRDGQVFHVEESVTEVNGSLQDS